MNRPMVKLDTCKMYDATSRAKLYIKSVLDHANEFTTDPRQDERLKEHECIACFYSSRIGGACMTEQPCAACGEEQSYGSTATDVLCPSCAKKYHLCKHCGGDLDMKVRRKWPVIEQPSVETEE